MLPRRAFVEHADGRVAISHALTRSLLDHTPTLAQAVAPIIEDAAQQLADGVDLGQLATPLTGRRRSGGRNGIRRRPTKAAPPSAPTTSIETVCADCGTPIHAGTSRCPTCHQVANTSRLTALRVAETVRRLESGRHPSQLIEVRDRIAEKQRRHQAARHAAGESGFGFTGRPGEFQRLIVPSLARLRAADLAHATGLSAPYCAQIRAGKVVPHIRHWAAFQLAGLVR